MEYMLEQGYDYTKGAVQKRLRILQFVQIELVLLLAQASQLAAHAGHWPVLQLDDLASELDRHHQQRVLQVLAGSGAQVFVTGTDPVPALAALDIPCERFHVEHGVVGRLA